MRRGMHGHVAEPRGPTRAPAWRGCDTCEYIHIIYIILRVIVHISIPYSELANPLFSSHLINASLSLNFYRVGLCSPFVFKCRWHGLSGASDQGHEKWRAWIAWTRGPPDHDRAHVLKAGVIIVRIEMRAMHPDRRIAILRRQNWCVS